VVFHGNFLPEKFILQYSKDFKTGEFKYLEGNRNLVRIQLLSDLLIEQAV